MNETQTGIGAYRGTCGRCRHSFVVQGDMVCRRFPPQMSIVLVPAPPPRVGQMMPTPLAGWPPVNATSSCGEFQMALQAVESAS